MIQWEYDYKIIEYDTWDEFRKIMNERGKEGWEVIQHGEIISPLNRMGEPVTVRVWVSWKRRKTIFVRQNEE